MRKKIFVAIVFIVLIFILTACAGKSSQVTVPTHNGMSGIEDLKDKRIGVLLGSIHDEYAAKTYPEATILQFKSLSDMLIALKAEKIDAAFFTHETLLEMMRTDKDLAFLGENLFRVPIGMGFNKNDDKLREDFNAFLKQSKADGVFDDMAKRWLQDGSAEMPLIEKPPSNGLFIVGVVSDKGLPFTTIKDNKMIGFDIEVAERFAAYLGKELVLQDMEFSSLIAAVASGKVDMIASTLVITDERKEQIDFSDPYYELGASVVVLKKNLDTSSSQEADITKLEELSDKRIGVLTGSAGDNAARTRFPHAQIYDMNNIIDAATALEGNKIDAVVFERTSLEGIVKDNPRLTVIEDPVELLDVAIAVKKNNPQLLTPVNKVISGLKDDGTLDDMKKRWFVDSNLPDMPELGSVPTSGTLRVGTEALMPPFEFVSANNELSGFDIELAERIGQAIGKKVIIENMNFNALIPALQSGKIDLAISCFNVTEERKQKIDYSVPYHTSETAAMVRAKKEAPESVSFFAGIKNSFYSNIIQENRYMLIIDGLKVTIIISLLSVILGTLLGGLICLMRMSKNRFGNTFARVYISIFRGTPVLVLLMLIFYVVFASVDISAVIVAIIAFGMNFAAYVSEMFRTSIESVDKGQREAGIASGFTNFQTFIYIIMPQAIRQVLPVYKGEFISMVKMTSIVGYIAVQDLTKAGDIIRSRTFDAFFPLVMVAVLYFIISWILTYILDFASKKTDPKKNRGAKMHTIS